MATTLGELDLDAAAARAAGNWRKFGSFCWHRATDLDDPDAWAIIYTYHRDSGLIDQSNAAVMAKELEPFTAGNDPDLRFERHSHWAVGWIDGVALRVFRDGTITEAFQVYHALAERMADYPVLDESDFSNREYQAALQNIEEAAWRLKREFDLPEGWEAKVFSWLWDHNQRAVENRDDQGGWPDEDDLAAAFAALGYPRVV